MILPILSKDDSKILLDGNPLKWTTLQTDDTVDVPILSQFLIITTESTADRQFSKYELEKTLNEITLSDLVNNHHYLIQLVVKTSSMVYHSNTLRFLASSKPDKPVITSVVPIDSAVTVNVSYGSTNGDNLSEIIFVLSDATEIFTVTKALNNTSPNQFTLSDTDSDAIQNYKTFEMFLC